jgi:pyruvate,water dikinase
MTLELETRNGQNEGVMVKGNAIAGTAKARAFEVLGWQQAYAAGPAVCGGKGYNLGRLDRYGFRVPRGGTIPAGWYTAMLNVAPEPALSFLRSVPGEAATQPAVLRALDEIRYELENAQLPAHMHSALAEFLATQGLTGATVSVRSSATAEDSARASFAGIHRSILGVRGMEAVSRAVLQCYASLWTPQALAYRRRMNFADDQVQCAAAICEMVRAEGEDEPHTAGVGFTFDPVSGRRDLVVIDAAPGLGEAVVSGRVDPQRIVFRNVKGKLVLDSRSAGPALLPPPRERELATLLMRLHWAFGDGQDPQDVEWAFDGRDIWILQVRPATNVRRFLPAPVSALPRHWSTANIKDAVPGVVCALSWSSLKDAVDAIAFGAATSTGYEIAAGAELVRRFEGRGYFELTLMQWVMYDALGIMPAELVKSIGGHQPEIPVPGDPKKGKDGRRRSMAMLRLLRRLLGIEKELARIVGGRNERLRKLAALDVTTLRPGDIAALFGTLEFGHDSLDTATGLANSAEGPWELALESVLKPVFGEQSRPLMGRLLAGTGSVTSAEHGYAIFELAAAARADRAALNWLYSGARATEWVELPADSKFRRQLEEFLAEYGHRAVYEADHLNPRWAEDPTYILEQVRFLLANPHAPNPREGAQRVREAAEGEVRTAAGWRAPVVFWLTGRLRRAMAVREAAKSAMVASAVPFRRLTLEIGRRLVKAGHLDDARQIFHLTYADLVCWLAGQWDGAGARELALDRARQREAWLAKEAPPDVITEEADGRVSAPAVQMVAAGDVWSGIGAAPGHARGLVRIVHHPNDARDLAAGEVLVAPSTDPGWTPLFLRASAIVMASGGYLSHGSIVAREYGIPAVVNLPGILTKVRNGDMLVVDGDRGVVTRESQ